MAACTRTVPLLVPPVDDLRTLLQHIADGCPAAPSHMHAAAFGRFLLSGALQWAVDHELVDLGDTDVALTAMGERYLTIIGGTP